MYLIMDETTHNKNLLNILKKEFKIIQFKLGDNDKVIYKIDKPLKIK